MAGTDRSQRRQRFQVLRDALVDSLPLALEETSNGVVSIRTVNDTLAIVSSLLRGGGGVHKSGSPRATPTPSQPLPFYASVKPVQVRQAIVRNKARRTLGIGQRQKRVLSPSFPHLTKAAQPFGTPRSSPPVRHACQRSQL